MKETLPANLAAMADYPNAEFIILDYGHRNGDEIEVWLKEHFSYELAAGRIVYARTEAPYFRMAHAKNMAHRLATGDIVCNLDADNVLQAGYAQWLNEVFTEKPDSIVGVRKSSRKRVSESTGESYAGIHGRIAMMRDAFFLLGGYDERYSGHGGEDRNLRNRANRDGLKFADTPAMLYGSVIHHDEASRTSEMSQEDRTSYEEKRALKGFAKLQHKIEQGFQSHPKRANADGAIGCGQVRVGDGGNYLLSEVNFADYAPEARVQACTAHHISRTPSDERQL